MYGICPDCGDHIMLKKDGTLRRHGSVRTGNAGGACTGGGKPPWTLPAASTTTPSTDVCRAVEPSMLACEAMDLVSYTFTF